MVKKRKTGFRLFYYFRTGYVTYFSMIVGVINILTSTYFLAAKKVTWILTIFPTFESYVIFSITVGIPIIVLTGWLHLKRVGTYAAEADISAEAHPYNYKLVPGILSTVYGPAHQAILKMNIKRVKREKLTEEEILHIRKLEDQLTKLIEGGYVGTPPKGAL